MIQIRTLGPVEVVVNEGAAPPELLWRKHLALLVYLARSPRRTRTREHLTALLWGDRPEAAARHSLREAVRQLRRALGDGLDEGAVGTLQLADDAVVLDVSRFETLAAEGDWAGAAALAEGEFLEGFAVPDSPGFEDWLAAERLTVRTREVEVLVRRASELRDRGDLRGAEEAARRALALDAASEPAACALMAALALAGRRTEALETADRLAALVRERFDSALDTQTAGLIDRIRRERPRERPGARSAPSQSRRAPLVGRQADLDLLLRWWLACRQERRAAGVCLYGDSGIGKSRLAEELAARCRLDGAATALMRATPADRERPWSGALALARSGLADVSGVGSAAPGALAAFAADLDEWADRFPGARRAAPLPMADALIAAVRAGADEQPIVLVLDDAQWLDSESLLSVGALLRDLAGRAVMVVLTAAPVPAREELDGICGRFGREVPGGVVRLAPLGGESLRELVRWAMPAFSPVEQDRLARRVAADAAGLPLLAVELLHAVGLGLDLHGTTGAWPEEHRTLDQTLPGALPEPVVAAVRMGFRRLSKDAQAVLVAAAVLDDPSTPDALARATGLAPDAVLAALDEAEWERWVGADGRGYHFVARLMRDVIARDMVTAGQRQRLRGQR